MPTAWDCPAKGWERPCRIGPVSVWDYPVFSMHFDNLVFQFLTEHKLYNTSETVL